MYICPQIPGGNPKIDFVNSKEVLVEVHIMIVTSDIPVVFMMT